jgi:hypothetical protein
VAEANKLTCKWKAIACCQKTCGDYKHNKQTTSGQGQIKKMSALGVSRDKDNHLMAKYTVHKNLDPNGCEK